MNTLHVQRKWLDRAYELHSRHPVVDTLSPNWDSEMYLSPTMVDLARQLKAQGLSRANIQKELANYLVSHIGIDQTLRSGYLDWWQRARVTAGSISLVFTGPPSRGWNYVMGAIARSERLLGLLKDHFSKALEPEDIEEAHRSNKHCVIYNLQNADPIGDDLSRVDVLSGLGVRIIQLTYNLRNLYGDGCVERHDGGLSRFGIALIEKLNAEGIVIDTSHCSDQTLLDALQVSTQPIAVTHSGSRVLGQHPRGKPDAILKALGDHGCYIGVLICPSILKPSGSGVTLDDVVTHIEYSINLAGSDAVGIGTDWGKPYYQIMDWTYDSIVEHTQDSLFDWVGWLPEHRFVPEEVCAGMETWDLWPKLTAKMLERGLSEDVVAKVIGGNFLRFWRAIRQGNKSIATNWKDESW